MEFLWIDSLKIWVGKHEVTNGEYRRMKPEHYSEVYLGTNLNGNRQPVVYVNFYGARVFAEWMTESDRASGHLPEGFRYRLPSRSEWEACAQCGDDREFPWGKEMPPRYGNYADTSAKMSFPKWSTIGGYDDGSPVSCNVENSGMNDWGLYGIGGNVWEAAASDSSGRFFGAWRGASWRHDSEYDLTCRHESVRDAASLESDSGFRLVLAHSAQ
jgi:formylglycine-generating enzyme required for sulfatase activity